MIYVLMCLLSGVVIVASRIFNTKLTEKIGLIESSYFNYFTAAITTIILFLIMREQVSLSALSSLPLYAYLGGILGVIIVVLNSVVTPKLSALYVTIIVFVAQLFTGILIDYLVSGIFPLNKVIGGILVILGLSYNLYIDSRES